MLCSIFHRGADSGFAAILPIPQTAGFGGFAPQGWFPFSVMSEVFGGGLRPPRKVLILSECSGSPHQGVRRRTPWTPAGKRGCSPLLHLPR